MRCNFAALNGPALAVAVLIGASAASVATAAPVASRVAGEAQLAAGPGDAQAYLDYAAYLMADNDAAGAAAVLERGKLKADPSADLLVALGHAYQAQQLWNKAEAATREALVLDAGHAGAHVQLGEIYLALGWTRSGIDSFRQAVALAPHDYRAQIRLVRGLCENGQVADAEQTCLEFIAGDPESAELWIALGRVYEKEGKRKEAFTTYGQALTIDPDAAVAWARQGKLFCEFGQFEAAAQSCRHALELDGNEPLAHAYLGIALSHLGDGDGARQHAAVAEAAGLNMTAVWRELGR